MRIYLSETVDLDMRNPPLPLLPPPPLSINASMDINMRLNNVRSHKPSFTSYLNIKSNQP